MYSRLAAGHRPSQEQFRGDGKRVNSHILNFNSKMFNTLLDIEYRVHG